MNSRLAIEGIIVPMITPFDDHEDLDREALKGVTNWLIDQGVHGLYPCSGCGEVQKLSATERQEVIDTVTEESRGRVLVIPGTGCGSTRETISLTQYTTSL